MQGPLSDPAVVNLLQERYVCVQEIIPGAQTRPADLSPERRALLERFSRHDRFFFGQIHLLSSDGSRLLGSWRSLPREDEATRKAGREGFLALAARAAGAQGGDVGAGRDSALQIGDPAPDFDLKRLQSSERFRLSDNLGRRPTVLIFHSFT